MKIAHDEVYVEIELDTARPYEQHDTVLKKHPATKKKGKKNKGI